MTRGDIVWVTQRVTIDRQDIDDRPAGEVPTYMVDVDAGLRLVLEL